MKFRDNIVIVHLTNSGWKVYCEKCANRTPRDIRVDNSMLNIKKGSVAFYGSYATKKIKQMLK